MALVHHAISRPCKMQPEPYNPVGVPRATSSCHVLLTQGHVHSPGTPTWTTAKPGTTTTQMALFSLFQL